MDHVKPFVRFGTCCTRPLDPLEQLASGLVGRVLGDEVVFDGTLQGRPAEAVSALRVGQDGDIKVTSSKGI
jgi:hypothetical protein